MESDRTSCVKTCPLRRRYNCFQRLFCLSYILTRIEIVLAVCIITGFTKFQLGSWSIDLSILPPLLNRTRFTGLKDIATTVGLTGVLFAWLLQIIGEKTCGITTDALFEWEYPQTVSKDNSLGNPRPPFFMLTQKIIRHICRSYTLTG